MSNRSCEDCRWNRLNPQGQRMIQCGQGHVRTFPTTIEDCHAWEREKLCWCQMAGERRLQLHDFDFGVYSMRSPEIPKFCPTCGQKIEREVKR
jgi:hypothetical protein